MAGSKITWQEKDYNYDTIKTLKGGFKNEKELKAFVVNNIKKLAADILRDEYVNHKTEYHLLQNSQVMRDLGLRKGRAVDLYLECKKSRYIIELKAPRYSNTVIEGVGQLLNYGRYFDDQVKLVLLTSTMDMETLFTIEKYKLPIYYCYVDKTKYAIPKNMFKTDPEKRIAL